jgi:hypothetical protein
VSTGLIPRSYLDGYEWFHFDCPEGPSNDDGIQVAGTCTMEVRFYCRSGAGLNRFAIDTYRVLCDSCGHAVRWVERVWDPVYPEGM